MVREKRGMITLVLGFLLLIAIIPAVSALNSNVDTYLGLYYSHNDDVSCDDESHEISEKYATLFDFPSGGCDFEKVNHFPEEGCFFFAKDSDPYDSACGYTEIYIGTKLTYTEISNFLEKSVIPKGETFNPESDSDAISDLKYGGTTSDDKDWFRQCHDISSDGPAYLCSDDHYWHQCSSDFTAEDGSAVTGSIGTVTWANDKLYNCTEDENDMPVWKELPGVDVDHDGYTASMGDCDDNTEDDPTGCPEPDEVGTVDCTSLQSAECAICINPSVAERCGDSINNDCNGGSRESDDTDDTSDNCNLNQEACTNGASALEASETEGAVTTPTKSQTNVRNEQFSWLDTEEGSYCCGYNGIDDLGKIAVANDASGNYLCLKNDENLLGKSSATSSIFPASCTESGWCWVPASGNAQFNILTLKKPGEPAYDVVSNSNKWMACNEDNLGPIKEDIYAAMVNPSWPNNFYCYKEGSHYSWAECMSAGGHFNINTIKGRQKGDSLYTLYLDLSGGKESPPEANLPAEIFYQKETLTLNSKSGQLDAFYSSELNPQTYWDFSGYDQLEFFFRFVNKEDGTPRPAKDIIANKLLPLDIRLELYAPKPKEGKEPIKYVDKSVFGDVVNNPSFSGAEEEWVHIRTKIPNNLKTVEIVKISSLPESNIVQIKNIYLSKSTDSEQPLCSGQESSSGSNWLTSFDDGNFKLNINAEEMCKEHYGKNAWLGNDNDVEQESANCCGNNKNEYYAGSSFSNMGCWNSQPIASGDTTMNVGFEVRYMQSEKKVSYDDITFNYDLVGASAKDTTYPWLAGIADEDENSKEGNIVITHGTTINDINEKDKCDSRNVITDSQTIKIQNTDDAGDFCTFSSSFGPTSEEGCPILISECDGGDDDCIGKFYSGQIGSSPAKLNSENFGDWIIPTEGDYSDEPEELTNPKYILQNYVFQGANSYFCGLSLEKGVLSKKWHSCTNNEITSDGSKLYQCYQDSWSELKLENYVLQQKESASINQFTILNKELDLTQLIPPLYLVWDNEENIDLSFYDPLSGEGLGSEIDLSEYKTLSKVWIIAKIKNMANFQTITPSVIPSASNLSYPCSSEVCLFPLPGEPPYTITNPHPELYDLYFVSEDGDKTKEVLISELNQPFPEKGNLLARKVAQQILYVNSLAPETAASNESEASSEEEFSEFEIGFYGCQAASFMESKSQLLPENNLPYCSIKAEKFCSYSHSYAESKDKYTTINTWSDKRLTQIGYAKIESVSDQEVSELYSGSKLQLKDAPAEIAGPENRNHSSIVLPARNFLPNAEFKLNAYELPYWDFFTKENQVPKDSEKSKINTKELFNRVFLDVGDTLRSEKIALNNSESLTYQLTFNGSCEFTISWADKDGKKTEVSTLTFAPSNAAYLQLEFYGPCELKQPMLQLLDDLGAVTYNYDWDTNEIERAGAACCPDNFCWNGYTCVEEMTSFTALSEHITEGRDYRCINGQWKHTLPQKDWNFERWGFCSAPNQCFVLGEQYGGNTENNASTFLDGKYPLCVNSGEYILDHYCEQGNWTSRTKFVANKLFEVGQNDDYILYCADYRDSFLQYKDENYLGGILSQQVKEISDNLLASPEEKSLATCFSALTDPEAKRLVGDKANTCINYVCLLRYKESGNFKVGFGTTLNRNINDPKSFLYALGLSQDKVTQMCKTAEGESGFVECDLSGTELEGQIWYSPTLNAIIYSKEGISLQPSMLAEMLDTFVGWFQDLFNVESELSDEAKFIAAAHNFRDVYMLSLGDKKVMAIKEILSADKNQTLVAEYEGFSTPMCDYVHNLKLPAEAESELLEEATGMENVVCSTDGTKQKVEAVMGLDFLWPQLTGKLRVEEE